MCLLIRYAKLLLTVAILFQLWRSQSKKEQSHTLRGVPGWRRLQPAIKISTTCMSTGAPGLLSTIVNDEQSKTVRPRGRFSRRFYYRVCV
uniref:Secreted protein n=1 Tax=Panagrellus redivivus TaxID=6233 RepID=A0A7E4W2Z4_PANRE